jgi:hypothetical protein
MKKKRLRKKERERKGQREWKWVRGRVDLFLAFCYSDIASERKERERCVWERARKSGGRR